jgi:hypothetical protein
MAALPEDDPAIAGARIRLAEVVIDTAREIVTGRLRREVLEAAGRLLGLEEREAAAHHECLLDRTHGLITDGHVDEGSINTLIELRQRHSPSADLDAVASEWPSMVTAAALGTGPRRDRISWMYCTCSGRTPSLTSVCIRLQQGRGVGVCAQGHAA